MKPPSLDKNIRKYWEDAFETMLPSWQDMSAKFLDFGSVITKTTTKMPKRTILICS